LKDKYENDWFKATVTMRFLFLAALEAVLPLAVQSRKRIAPVSFFDKRITFYEKHIIDK
jgi:hypothetical protein